MVSPIYRALVLSPTPTWPLDFGNRKRIYSVCSHLKEIGFEIHFVHYASEGDWRSNLPMESRIKMDKQWDMVDHIFPSVELHAWPNSADDHMIDEWWDPVLENHLEKVFASRVYDLVLVNYTWLSRAMELVPTGILKVLDTHDKFSGRRQILEANGINKEYFHTTEVEELRGLDRADLVWAIKKEEEQQFSSMGVEADLETLIHLDEFRKSMSPFECKTNKFLTYGFIGAKNNINKINIQNFVETALPIFEKYLPPIEILIAGSICGEIDLPENSFIKILGYVEHVDCFYDAIDVAVIPMEFSTGLKIKAGEALSQGKPLISHLHAMEGYPATHPLHHCASFEDIAIAMCELAYEPSLLDELTKATYESNKICTNEIFNVFKKLETRIAKRTNVVCFLPMQYGDVNKSLVHWLVKAQMEWLGWKIAPVFISLNKSQFGYSDSRVRYFTEGQAIAMLTSNKNTTIYNLDECLPDSIRSISTRIIEYFCKTDEGNTVKQSFFGGRDSVLVPGFGPTKIPWLTNLLENDQKWGIAVLATDTLRSGLTEFLEGLKIDSTEAIVEFQASTFVTLERSIDDYIVRFRAMPRVMVVPKSCVTLNYAEQLLVDMFMSHGIRVLFASDIIDHSFELDDEFCPETQREIYSNYFFTYWEAAERIIQKSNSVRKKSVSNTKLIPELIPIVLN